MNENYDINNISKKLFESRLQIKNHIPNNFFQQPIDNSKTIEKYSFITNVVRPKISKITLKKPNSIYSKISNNSSRNTASVINNNSNNNNRKINSNSLLFKNKLLTFSKYCKTTRNNSKEKSNLSIKNITYRRCKKNMKCKSNSNTIRNGNSVNNQDNSQKVKINKNNIKKKKLKPIAIYIDNPFKKKNHLNTPLCKNQCLSFRIKNKIKISYLENSKKENSLPNKFKNKHNNKISENLERKFNYFKKIPTVKIKRCFIYKYNSNKNINCGNLNKKIFHIKLKYSKQINSKNKLYSKDSIKNKVLQLGKIKMTKISTSKNSKNKNHNIRNNYKRKIFDFSSSLKDLKLKKNKKNKNDNKKYITIPTQKITETNNEKKNNNSLISNDSVKNIKEKSSDSSSESGILTLNEVKDIIIYNDMNNVKRNQNFLFFLDDHANFISKNNLWLEKLFFRKNKNSKKNENLNLNQEVKENNIKS